MIDDNNKTNFVDTYAKYLQIEAQLKLCNEKLNSFNVDIDDLEALLKKQLNELEYSTFIEYNTNLNSLKRIAHSRNHSYPYVRKIYITAKSKIDIIAGVLSTKGNKTNN